MPVCAGCGASASENLCCPTCAKGGYAAFFCSQSCFEKNWKQHSKLHGRIGGSRSHKRETGAGAGKSTKHESSDGLVDFVQRYLGAPGGKGKSPVSLWQLCLLSAIRLVAHKRLLVLIIVIMLILVFHSTNSTLDVVKYKHQPVGGLDLRPSSSDAVPGALEAQVKEMQKRLDEQASALAKLVAKFEQTGQLAHGEVNVKVPPIVDDFEMGSMDGTRSRVRKPVDKTDGLEEFTPVSQSAPDFLSNGGMRTSPSVSSGSNTIGSVKVETPAGQSVVGVTRREQVGLPQAEENHGEVKEETPAYGVET